jgi:hypothetical protein
VVIIQVPLNSWKMSITGFCLAETLDFCWRDDIGKEQVDGFINQVAQAGIPQENVKRRFALANLPKVSFKSMQRERDWIAYNQDVQFYLQKQKERLNPAEHYLSRPISYL